jgi:hypothetical protein
MCHSSATYSALKCGADGRRAKASRAVTYSLCHNRKRGVQPVLLLPRLSRYSRVTWEFENPFFFITVAFSPVVHVPYLCMCLFGFADRAFLQWLAACRITRVPGQLTIRFWPLSKNGDATLASPACLVVRGVKLLLGR